MDKLKVGVVNLGCDKNRIDSEIIISKLSEKYDVVNNPEIADIILINTCGFIEASKQESINTILEMTKYKEKHTCKVLIATGCLTQRYGSELLELIPELDIILGVNDYEKLHDSINDVINKQCKICECNFSDSNINEGDRVVTTGKNSAYIRIAEGCDNVCAYCAIPKIRGKYRSRKMENIILEAKDLAEKGYKEIILVAQDTTRYGIDIYGTKKLHELIKEITKIDSIKWIRILYCYAEELTDEIIDEIALNDKVCKYIDIPIQHISDEVLKNMRRRGRKKQITDNIKKLRDKISEVTLRTSIIVGFPGETKDNFNELKDYIKNIKFDKMGVFKYSQEDGTVAADMENQIEDEVKEQREEELMLMQQKISRDINERKIGKVYDVLVESFDGEMYHGRNYEMSPEVDGEILFKCDKIISEGKFVKVKITEALEYDLIGVVLNESCE